ncbi:3',5'-cyclic adenosine monophosphate phosphodiesterase CpdA [Chromobacterium violaceum]|uniref:3',5'-cyclic adenosine monophosphate phosphodiesterase CpdA n=1 Tax=Chromobacterium violaceum TaxID=536 RepID=A0A447T7C3_CHRVL|nr:3',5'-cyclic adenosine monophosphate phosphodiesterase CpdA [Chromobacterium violaceum]
MKAGQKMRIAQLTDLHLFADRQGRLLGRDTHAALDRVLAALRTAEGVEAVLLTGDVSQDESEASYHLAAEALAALGVPVHWIAGNHDDRAAMARVFAGYTFLRPLETLALGGWTFIGVDSCVAGQDGGRLSDAGLDRLRRLLDEAGDGRPPWCCTTTRWRWARPCWTTACWRRPRRSGGSRRHRPR